MTTWVLFCVVSSASKFAVVWLLLPLAPSSPSRSSKLRSTCVLSFLINVSSSDFLVPLKVLTKDEGGRYTPFMSNYRPQLFLRTADITVSLTFPDGTPDANEKMVMPGDNVEMVCDLVHDVAAEVGTRFTLREGGKTSE